MFFMFLFSWESREETFVGELSWESRGRRELGGTKPHYGLWGDLGDSGEIVIFAISII